MGKVILKVSNLGKSYNKGKNFTVSDVSFSVEEGQIVGLVGRNGVGKSTIIKSITGILPFEKGEALINDFDVSVNPVQAKRCLGYVPDVSNAFDRMTGLEYLNFVADIFNVSKEIRQEKINEFQSMFPLGDNIHKLINSYSHGMKQKISIMASLLSEPKLWILDEPITGLDPQTALSLTEYMKKYAEKGNAVLFSSHNLDVVEKICDRVIIINNGKLVYDNDIDELKKNSKKTLEQFFMEKSGK